MAELVFGAALGAAFTVLQEAVNKATVGKFNKFKLFLRALQTTLESIQPLIIKQIEEYNVKLELPNDEIEELGRQMMEGEDLIRKLSKLGWWNRFKSSHTKTLIELDGSLKRLLKHLVMQQARDIKENLIVARKTAQQIVELQQDTRQFALALQENGKQLVEFQEFNERLLEERTLLQEGAKDLHMSFVTALENNGKQLAMFQQVIGQMMKPQEDIDAETGGHPDDIWLKPNQDDKDQVWALFCWLVEGVQELINKDVIWNPVLKSIETTLNLLKDHCTNIMSFRTKKQVKALRTQMGDGVKLFRKCSSIQTWNMYRKFNYANQLIQWDDSLQKEIAILLEGDGKIVRPHKSTPGMLPNRDTDRHS